MRLPSWRRLAAVLPLAAITLVIVGVSYHYRQAPPRVPSAPPQTEPDYFLRGAQIRSYGPDDRLLHSLNASSVAHYPDDSARLLDVAVERLPGPWELTAARGMAPSGLRSLELHGDVVLSTEVSPGSQARLYTEALRVDLQQQTLVSLAPVRVESARVAARADTLEADLASRGFALNGNVHVEHQP